jgi:hypothetical protein
MRATSQGAENSERRFDGEWKNGQPSESQYLMIGMLSFAKTRSPLVSTTWGKGCNVVELGCMRRLCIRNDDGLLKRLG